MEVGYKGEPQRGFGAKTGLPGGQQRPALPAACLAERRRVRLGGGEFEAKGWDEPPPRFGTSP